MEKESTPLVSIIILNYNAGDLLLECVESLLNTRHGNYEILVVDNASKDNSHKRCKEKFPIVNIIENTENRGYCEGNNVGMRLAKGTYVVILNPDAIVDPDWLNGLIQGYETYGEGLYQPKFLTTSDHSILMSSGNMIQIFGFGYSRGKGQIDTKQFEKHEVVGFASGTCLFTHIDVIKKIGMFDSFLFAYLDDMDLGWRALLLGIRSHYIPESIVYHPPEGFSFKWSNYKFYLLERNRLYCLFTHYSYSTLFRMMPALFLTELAIILFYLKKRMIRQKINGYIDIVKNRQQIKKRHNEIQKTRTISDKEIIKNFQDRIYVPEKIIGKKNNEIFNKYIECLAKITRKFI